MLDTESPTKIRRGAVAAVRAATKGAVVSDKDNNNRDKNDNRNRENGDKYVDVVNVISQIPKKRQSLD